MYYLHLCYEHPQYPIQWDAPYVVTLDVSMNNIIIIIILLDKQMY